MHLYHGILTRLLLPVLLLPLLFCAEKVSPTNPYDSGYDGDYRFGIEIQPPHDTFSVFHSCSVAIIDSGRDEFQAFNLATEPAGTVKTVFKEPSPLPLYFTAPFTGELIVTGVHPNDRTVEYRDSVVVVNPYRIDVDSATLYTGTSVRFRIVNSRGAADADSALSARWTHAGESSAAARSFDTPFAVPVTRPCTVTVSAVISDTFGNTVAVFAVYGDDTSSERTAEVTVTADKPVLEITSADDSIALGDTARYQDEHDPGNRRGVRS